MKLDHEDWEKENWSKKLYTNKDGAYVPRKMIRTKSRVTFGPRKELYDYIVAHCLTQYGHLLEYSLLADILGRDPQENGRQDILTVSDWLLEDFGVNLTCEAGKGYFIALQEDSRHLGNKRDRRAHRELTKAVKIFKYSNVDQLNPEQYKSHAEDAKRVAIKYLLMRKIDKSKQIDHAETISIPSGKELTEIYKRAI